MNESYIKKFKDYLDLIFKALNGRKLNSNNIREKVVAGYLSLAIQHHSSIILLVERNVYSSAFALLRPLFESVYRGIWFSIVSNDDELEKFCKKINYKFKPIKTLAKEIDEKEGRKAFVTVCEKILEFLHGMTHGGIGQISRQFDKEGSVFVSFSDKDLSSLLNNANVLISRLLIEYDKFQDDNTLKKLGEEIIRNKFE